MTIKFSEVRQGIAAQIGTLAGYNESKFPPAYFARQENTLAHKSFSVGVQTTDEAGDRQRRSIYYFSTTYEIKIAYRLRPLDVYPIDYDNALDAEEIVIKRILQDYASVNNKIQIRFVRASREIPDSLEFIISTLEFTSLQTI